MVSGCVWLDTGSVKLLSLQRNVAADCLSGWSRDRCLEKNMSALQFALSLVNREYVGLIRARTEHPVCLTCTVTERTEGEAKLIQAA